jgi:kumamolisin
VLNAVLNASTKPAVLSVSYGCAEEDLTASDMEGWNALIQSLADAGVPSFFSSGDSGAYGRHALLQPQIQRVSAPASCPAAIAVGGTALYMNGYAFEQEWGWSNDINNGASGGGYSTVFTRPAYQDQAVTGTQRGVPDVAGPASTTTYAYLRVYGQLCMIGGTSWAAPVVAGLFTRIAQARATAKLGPLGDLHDAIYQHGDSLCRDITTGNNTCYAVAGFNCTTGWDAVTGMGSPQYAAWLAYLTETTTPTPSKMTPMMPEIKGQTLQQLSAAPNGFYGNANTHYQVIARRILGDQKLYAEFAALVHRPVTYWQTSATDAQTLAAQGVQG